MPRRLSCSAALFGLLCFVSRPASSDEAASDEGRRYFAETPEGLPVVLTLRADARVALTFDGADFAGRWRACAETRCLRFWDDEAPDLGCVLVVREGREAYLVDEERRVRLRLRHVPADAIELPLHRG